MTLLSVRLSVATRQHTSVITTPSDITRRSSCGLYTAYLVKNARSLLVWEQVQTAKAQSFCSCSDNPISYPKQRGGLM